MIVIGRKGNIPTPVQLRVEYSDGTSDNFHHTAGIWKDGKQNLKIRIPQGKSVKKATLGVMTIPDVTPADNTWEAGR